MKKMTILALGAMAFALASCNKSENTSSTTLTDLTVNHIVAADGSVYVSPGKYQYAFEDPAATVALSALDVDLSADRTDVTFNLEPMAYAFSAYETNFEEKYVQSYKFVSANPTSTSGAKISNLNCELYAQYLPDFSVIRDYPVSLPINFFTVMSYTLENNYKVRTFWNDVLFTGPGSFTPAGGGEPIKDPKAVVRVQMNLKDRADYKANIFLYSVDFRQNDDKKNLHTLIIRDVPLTFDADGWKINASDLKADEYIRDANGTDKIEKDVYKIESLRISSSGNLTSSALNCRIADKGAFNFTGSYILPKK